MKRWHLYPEQQKLTWFLKFRIAGERIGKGQTIEQARCATESVVEGITTCESVIALAERYSVEMPITQAIYQVLFENKPVRTAIADLMKRRLKAE